MSANIIVNSEVMGSGPEDLGKTLMGSFLRKLCMSEKKPDKLIFYNTGVKLIAEGSPVLDTIEILHKAGVEIIACGTCVNYFKLAEKIAPVMIGDMQTIVSIMMDSDAAVSI